MRFRGHHRNFALCLALECLWAIHFSVAITVKYYEQFGIDITTVLAMQVLMNLVSTVCDAPFGYLVVRFGVERVLRVCTVFQLVQCLLFAFWCRTVPEFSFTLCLTGMSWALSYGTTKAIMTATDPEEITTYSAYAVQVRASGQLFGVFVGGQLAAHVSVSTPVMIQPITFALAIPVAWLIITSETIHARTHPKFSSVWEIGKIMLIRRPKVRWMILLVASINAAVLAMMWLAQPDMEAAGVHLDMFGYVYLIRTLATMTFALFASKLAQPRHRLLTQLVLTTSVVACAVFAGLPTNIYGAVAILLANALAAAITDPLLTDVIRCHVPEAKNQAATVYSVASGVQSTLFVVSPIMGWVSQHYSSDAALLCIALCTLLFSGYCTYRYQRAAITTL